MAKGSGRHAALSREEMTDFGRRLDEEFQSLGYFTRADQARALSGFQSPLYPSKVTPTGIRAWLTGSLPKLDAADLLGCIGVDLHYCRTGQRSGRPWIRPEDGFDLGELFRRYDGLDVSTPVLWSAEETLHMWRVRESAKNGVLKEFEVFDAFENTMRRRALAAGVVPVAPAKEREPTADDHVNLWMWYRVWARDFSIEGSPSFLSESEWIGVVLKSLSLSPPVIPSDSAQAA